MISMQCRDSKDDRERQDLLELMAKMDPLEILAPLV